MCRISVPASPMSICPASLSAFIAWIRRGRANRAGRALAWRSPSTSCTPTVGIFAVRANWGLARLFFSVCRWWLQLPPRQFWLLPCKPLKSRAFRGFGWRLFSSYSRSRKEPFTDFPENQDYFSEVERAKDDLVVSCCHECNGLRGTRAKTQWSGSDFPLSRLFQVV